MIKPGTVIFSIPDNGAEAAQDARDFCRTRGLTSETAKIVKRNARIEVEIKKPCLLKVGS